MSQLSIDDISNRIRYESISNFAKQIGKVDSFNDIEQVLKRNVKFIVSAYRFVTIFYSENQIVTFNFLENFEIENKVACDLFNTVEERPYLVNRDEADDNTDEIIDLLFQNERVNSAIRIVAKREQEGFIAYYASKEDFNYGINDIKFVHLIGEILHPKVKSIILRNGISQKNRELTEANKIIQRTNNEINSSLDYAALIQEALLQSKDSIKEHFPKNFILYMPRDKISGDFYFSHENNDFSIIIAADCTGHGIPGAMLSIFGVQILREICRDVHDLRPDLVLIQLEAKFREYLKISISKNEVISMNDGMDIAAVTVCKNSRKICFSSASRPFIYAPLQSNDLTIIKGSRFPIGNNRNHRAKEFKLHMLDYQEGDRFYIFSDGYTDQFGGPNDKKFGSRRLNELLMRIKPMQLEEQLYECRDTIQNWKGESEQIDDILFIGVEL